MSEAQDAREAHDEMTAEQVAALSQRIDAINELIALILPSPANAPAAEVMPPTVETLTSVSQRLGRLFAQAGMSDGVRSAEMLERAGADLPSEESFRNIDAALTYLHGRLMDVTRKAAPTVELPAIQPAVTVELPAVSPPSPSAPSDAQGDADAPANDLVIAADEEPAEIDDAPELDLSKYSPEKQAAIRAFQVATLRERAPGEVSGLAGAASKQFQVVGDEISEPMRQLALAEASNDLEEIRSLIAAFSKDSSNLEPLRGMAQLGHKVKGTVSMFGIPRLADMLHRFESLALTLQPVAARHPSESLNILIKCSDMIESGIREAAEQRDISLDCLAVADELATEAQALATSDTSSAAATASDDDGTGDGGSGDGDAAAMSGPDISLESTAHLPAVHRAGDEEMPRVEPHQLDNLMQQADGLAMNRAMLAQSTEEIHGVQSDVDQVLARLSRLSSELSDLHAVIAMQGNTVEAGASGPRLAMQRKTDEDIWVSLDVDANTAVDESLRALSEAVQDATTLISGTLHGAIQRLSRNSDDQRAVLSAMQQTIIHLRLVSLDALATRVSLAVHQLAHSEGKQVEISIVGQDTEIDRTISDALIEPMVQLARNAVAHGIESPAEREALGKPAIGKVWLHASYSGNEVHIEIGDDGRGVNPHYLIVAAISAGILDRNVAEYLTREQALKLMFEPNLSTKEHPNVIAGHGIGLDGVRKIISDLRGTITARSAQGQGTAFQIRVPISLSLTRALRVRVGVDEYAIPISMIRQMISVPETSILVSLNDAEANSRPVRFPRRIRVVRTGPEKPLRMPDDPTAPVYDEVPVFSLAELLGSDATPKTSYAALLVDAGQRQVAILVDEVLEDAEIVIRTLPAHLRRHAVRGASVMADGRLFLVIDLPVLLADVLGGGEIPRPQPPMPRTEPRDGAPVVLVVDDSISMRFSLQSILMGAGYQVRLARDGVEALGILMEERPDAMLLDIEMPRLDGFELLGVIRANPALAPTPVLILTSRAAEKHHQQALGLGVRGYLTKPCPDDVLIGALQRVLRERQTTS